MRVKKPSAKALLSSALIPLLLFLPSCGKMSFPEGNASNIAASSNFANSDVSLFCHEWYRPGNDSPNFILYSDGTCSIGGTYGTGTWSIVNNNLLKVTDVYSSSWTKEIFSVSDTKLVLGFSDGTEEIYWSTPELAAQAQAEADAAAEEEANVEAARAEEEAKNAPLEIQHYGSFSDGLAWISFTKQGTSYLACIDKTGTAKLLYQDCTPVGDFSNGYACIISPDTLYVIDVNGKSHISFPDADNIRILTYGDGYTLLEEYASSFDSAGYTYTIYAGDGSVETQFTSSKQLSEAYYSGQGVFYIPGIETEYYCIGTHSWQNFGSYPQQLSFYEDSLSFVETLDLETDSMLHTCGFSVADSNGNVRNIYLDSVFWNIVPSKVKDNICIVYGNDAQGVNGLISYDLRDDSIHRLDDDFFSKLDFSNSDFTVSNAGTELLNISSMQNSLCILPLRGADGNSYHAVFNKDWTPVYGPTTDPVDFSGNFFYVIKDGSQSYYDAAGNHVYTDTEIGYTTDGLYHDGAVLAKDGSGNVTYLDETGTPLFSELILDNIPVQSLE